MSARKVPTLTDAKGMGGIVAQDGFDYQVWDALARLPSWLRNPAFEGFAVEVLEDCEARFFAPHAPRGYVLDRIQAKSGVLDRARLVEVFENFFAFEAANPKIARVQTLVTPALPQKLAWLARDAERVRKARPFYAPFDDVSSASLEKLRDDFAAELGPELGHFAADGVEVDIRPLSDRRLAEAAFAAALHDAFPDSSIPQRKISAAFSAMLDLVSSNRGVLLDKFRILDLLRDELDCDLSPGRHVLPLHVRSDRMGERAGALEIDATAFSGAGDYPDPSVWRSALVTPLLSTAAWAKKAGYVRVDLSGSFRLSTGFGIGWAFRSAIGFEIEVPTKTGPWPTDAHGKHGVPNPPCSIDQATSLLGDRLLVGIGVIRDPGPAIAKTFGLENQDRILLASQPQALTDAFETQACVQTVKSAVAEAVARLSPARIDLFYVGPSSFAVALGHRWNALPPTQLYEFVAAEGVYTPTLKLP